MLPIVFACILCTAAWPASGHVSFRLFRLRWRFVRCWTPGFTKRTYIERLLMGPLGLAVELVYLALGVDSDPHRNTHLPSDRK